MKLADWLSLLNIAFTVLAILAAPVIALWVSAKLQNRADAAKAKLELFATTLEIRHDLLSPEFVRTLNSIDVVFVDDFAVREAWSRYYSVLSDSNLNNPAGWSIRDEKRRDLLLAMAKAMGWEGRISMADILRTYMPQFIGEQTLVTNMERQIKLATYTAELSRLGLPHPLTGFQVPPTAQQPSSGGAVISPISPTTAAPPPAQTPNTPPTATGSEEGFYTVNYGGQAGGGAATVLFRAGTIHGFDTAGGAYDGTYQREPDGSLRASISFTLPPGVPLVTGTPAQNAAQTFLITARLPVNFGGGVPVTIELQEQQVQVVFTKIRGLPSPGG